MLSHAIRTPVSSMASAFQVTAPTIANVKDISQAGKVNNVAYFYLLFLVDSCLTIYITLQSLQVTSYNIFISLEKFITLNIF